MVTIPGVPGPILVAASRRRRVDGSGFLVPDASEPAAAAPAAPVQLGGLLAMQEAAGAAAADGAAQRQG